MTRQGKSGLPALFGGAMAIFFPGALIFGMPGVMARYWQDQLGMSRGDIGNILFFLLAAVGIFMFFVGRFQQRLGIRRMITFGGAVCGLNLLTVAWPAGPWNLYLWAFINGAGSAFIYIPALTTVQFWHPERRGLAAGTVNLAFGGAAAVMSPIFAVLLGTIGYAPLCLVTAAASVIVSVGAAQFTDPPDTLPAAPSTGAAPRNSVFVDSLTVGQAARTGGFWCLWLTWALMGGAGIAMVTLSTTYGLDRGYGLEHAVVILTAFNLTNGASRLVMGYLSDRFGRNRTMSLTFLAAGAAYMVLPHVSGLALIAILAAFVGAALGTLFAVSAPLVSDCFGLEHFGSILGLVFTAYGFMAGVIGPSLAGYILDATDGNYILVFTILGAYALIAGVLVPFVRPAKCAIE